MSISKTWTWQQHWESYIDRYTIHDRGDFRKLKNTSFVFAFKRTTKISHTVFILDTLTSYVIINNDLKPDKSPDIRPNIFLKFLPPSDVDFDYFYRSTPKSSTTFLTILQLYQSFLFIYIVHYCNTCSIERSSTSSYQNRVFFQQKMGDGYLNSLKSHTFWRTTLFQ